VREIVYSIDSMEIVSALLASMAPASS